MGGWRGGIRLGGKSLLYEKGKGVPKLRKGEKWSRAALGYYLGGALYFCREGKESRERGGCPCFASGGASGR